MNNLLTSCYECNHGKMDRELTGVPPTLSESIDILKERQLQYEEYQGLVHALIAQSNKDIDMVEKVFRDEFDRGIKEGFRQGTIKKYIKLLGLEETISAMVIACNKIDNTEQAIRYFCGVCKNKYSEKLKELEDDKHRRETPKID